MVKIIEAERQKLHKLIEEKGILDEETIKQSKLMDKLILVTYKRTGKRLV